MHRCFSIAEVLREIVAFLRAHSEANLGSEGFATIASLAVTCRTFYEIASDELWGKLFGITPLVKCLPEEVLGQTAEGVVVSVFTPIQMTTCMLIPKTWTDF